MGVPEVAGMMLDSRNAFSSADFTSQGKILTATALFRGNTISAYEVESTIAHLKQRKAS